MGLGLGLGIWWSTQTSIIPSLLKLLEARADYFENKICTTAILEGIAAVRYTAPVLPIGLLADYPGASAAYSLRNLIDTTTNVVRVRRSSDNTEQDFTSAEITDGTLTTFTGANDGFVAIWYDQSGNGVNAIQSTATRQPRIIISGVLQLDNSSPAIKWGANFWLNLNTSLTNVNSVFQVLNAEVNTGVNSQFLLGHSTAYDYRSNSEIAPNIFDFGSSNFNVRDGNNYINGIPKNFQNTARPITQSIISMIHLTASGRVNQLTKDRTQNNRSWAGKMQEIILYSTDQTTNRTAIETNINNYYSIF